VTVLNVVVVVTAAGELKTDEFVGALVGWTTTFANRKARRERTIMRDTHAAMR
jgi:hypothetical protein